jgi:WD40 repeat protein
LYCSQQENREDVEKFLRTKLADVATATGEPLDSLVGNLLEKSGGQFLYARLLVTEVRANPTADLSALPTDLTAYYAESMSRLKKTSSATLFKQLFAVIEAVCTFYLPPSLALLSEFVLRRCASGNASAAGASVSSSAADGELLPPVDLSDAETRTDAVQRLLLPLSSLFPFDAASASVTVYHKTVSDFFKDQRRRIPQPDITVHPTTVHQIITELCVQLVCTAKSAQSDHAGGDGLAAVAAASAASHPSAASSFGLPSLPWLRMLKVNAALADNARAADGPPAPSAAWLRYAACFAAEHAVAAHSVPLATALLSHPQYLHMRTLYQKHAPYLTTQYAKSITLAEAAQREWEDADDDDEEEEEEGAAAAASNAKSNAVVCLTSSPLRRALHLPILRSFYRLYLQHGRRWAALPELVYQCAASFPDDLPPAQLAQQLLPWLSKWKHRKYAVMQWENKPQQLSELIGTLSGYTGLVISVAHSPDGQRIVTGGSDRIVRVWDAIDLTELAKLTGHARSINSVTVSPDGRRIVSGSDDQTLRVWDAVNFALLATLEGHTSRVTSVCWNGDGRRIMSGDNGGRIHVWDAVSFALVGTMAEHIGAVQSVAFIPDGTRIVSCSSDKTVRVWDAASFAELKSLEGHSAGFTAVAFSPDGSRIICADEEGFLCLWDAHSFDLLHQTKCSETSLFAVAFSSDGTRILVGGEDAQVRLYDAHAMKPLKSFSGHTHDVSSVAFSPDGTRIISASADKTVRLWDATDLREVKAHDGRPSSVAALALSSDGRRMVSGHRDNVVRVWNAQTGDEIAVLLGHIQRLDTVAISSDGSRIFSADDHSVRVWDGNSFAELVSLEQPKAYNHPFAVNPEGSRILIGSEDSLAVWDALTYKEITAVKCDNFVRALTLSPEGARIAAYNWSPSQGRLYLFAASDLAPMAKSAELEWVFSLSFSPDSRRIVTGGEDAKVHVWDAADFKTIATLEGHTESVFSVSFSGDGRFIVSGSSDCTVRVWCASNFRALRTLTGHTGAVFSVAVNHDGSQIFSGSGDQTIRCWSLLVPAATGGAAAEPARPCHFISDNAGTGLIKFRQLC